MALPIIYGIDPDETWEVDFLAAQARRLIRANRAGAEAARNDAAKIDPERTPEAEREAAATRKGALEKAAAFCNEKAAKLEADLAAYQPGSGPVFLVAPLPNGKRGELIGEAQEVARLDDGKECASRDLAWSEQVVRWSVRGHRNLKKRNGQEIPFASEDLDWAGEKRKVVGRKTLEAYGATGILGSLALLILDSQRIDEAGKNA